MEYGLVVNTAPTVLPVTVADMKLHLRVDVTDEDNLIEALIKAARARMERELNRTLLTTSWKLTMDYFPTVFFLPRSPAISVTSVKYYDTGGTQQTLSSSAYQLVSGRRPSRIVEAYGYSWPSVQDKSDAVEVIYSAGEGAAATSIPEDLVSALKLDVAHLFENREAVMVGAPAIDLPRGYDSLTRDYKIHQRAMH